MSGRGLAFAFLSLLLLLMLNAGIYFWSESARRHQFAALENALLRQLVMASIKQRLNDLNREITLLSGVSSETRTGGRTADEMSRFTSRLEAVRSDISEARRLSGPEAAEDLQALRRAFENLASSWTVVYQSLGTDSARAVTELSLHAEPLAETLIGGLLREWEGRERLRASAARASLAEVDRLVHRIALSTFVVTMLLAVVLAVRVRRQLSFLNRQPAA